MSSAARRPRVAFQGERGAFSEEAAIKLLGFDIELVPRPTFSDLFKSVDDCVADYVLAPFENSLVGPIQPVGQLLQETSLAIAGEVEIPIEQHLIGCPEALLDEIETVESHPVALAQCQRFFALHPQIKQVEAEDTAGSVARIIALGDVKRAAIAGRRAAKCYGGRILKENVEDDPENRTRFLLLGKAGHPTQTSASGNRIDLVGSIPSPGVHSQRGPVR
ncbi:MAG TPA: prephenate dehydratase domain-containing protein [Pyrinomonadaceae bacterium]|jgi:prephenate dehydratase